MTPGDWIALGSLAVFLLVTAGGAVWAVAHAVHKEGEQSRGAIRELRNEQYEATKRLHERIDQSEHSRIASDNDRRDRDQQIMEEIHRVDQDVRSLSGRVGTLEHVTGGRS